MAYNEIGEYYRKKIYTVLHTNYTNLYESIRVFTSKKQVWKFLSEKGTVTANRIGGDYRTVAIPTYNAFTKRFMSLTMKVTIHNSSVEHGFYEERVDTYFIEVHTA